ncbi:Dam family site-specific DNA-(adenine-N6)-methyltransferase [Inquilinus sp. Marseille-Q2685]|uniref:DNA adenine methylase n=1 Tax=Inquilinus sp. Marseille-Q2685 TaxID=2866581 RepID=UPI001CE42C84|nr:Dam family site-specific DNA-(adenine-N6)-methyltransferase [Inquilinus sp. Marseille-Q2685]
MKPFLKWAGGKRWLAYRLGISKLDGVKKYIEPFVGSGAIFFHFQPENSILNDFNKNLVNTYKAIRDNVNEVVSILESHQKCHSAEYYYNIRNKRMEKMEEKAAQFIYLNRTCWNGLYRENKFGEFNVPKGTKDKVIFPDDDFISASMALKNAELYSDDFEAVIEKSNEGDLIFADPPYTVKHNRNGFLKYNEKIFSWDDQIRLRDCILRASQRGVKIVMTNAYHTSISCIYEPFAEITPLERHSVLSAKKNYRSTTQESLITINIRADEILSKKRARIYYPDAEKNIDIQMAETNI